MIRSGPCGIKEKRLKRQKTWQTPLGGVLSRTLIQLGRLGTDPNADGVLDGADPL